jgi:hypothetical protein
MTYYADLSPLPDPRLHLVAVGWLAAAHPYERGRVDEPFFLRLMSALVDPWQPFAAGGFHRCEFCQFSGGPGRVNYSSRPGDQLTVTVGATNLFVPGRGVLYMAPSLIVHYIDAHDYTPPREFIDAVLACPEMRSADYLRAIRAVGGARLRKPTDMD